MAKDDVIEVEGKVVDTMPNAMFTKGLAAAKEAGQLASEELVYQSNSHASKEYRMEMVKAMVQRLAKEVAQ